MSDNDMPGLEEIGPDDVTNRPSGREHVKTLIKKWSKKRRFAITEEERLKIDETIFLLKELLGNENITPCK